MSNDTNVSEQFDLLDLNALLIADPPARFLVLVAGYSMTGIGIASGDMQVIDKDILEKDGSSDHCDHRWALLHKSAAGRTTPIPIRIYPMRTVCGVPKAVKRFRIAAQI